MCVITGVEMYELLLNAVKVLASKEARDTGRDLLNLVVGCPEWKKDICNLTLRIDSNSHEQAAIVRELAVRRLKTNNYHDAVIVAFESIYGELTTNAFEYGLVNSWWRKGKIEINVEISAFYVTLVVHNTKGVRLDFETQCEIQNRLLTDNPRRPRGRGLLTVRQLADQVLSLENGGAIKAVLYEDCVDIDFIRFDNLVIFKFLSGGSNPHIVQKLENHLRHYPDHQIILDFSRFRSVSTAVMGRVMAHREKRSEADNLRLVAIYPDIVHLDLEDVSSYHEALERLGRLDLLNDLARKGLK